MQGKFFIKTFGCQMNVADTERMSALLSDAGMDLASGAEDADLILINGCSVREKAVHKAVSELGRYQEFKDEDSLDVNFLPKGPIIGLGGCVGQLDKGEIFTRAPYLDFVFGTDVIDELPEIVESVRRGARHSVHVEFDRSKKYSTETKVFGTKAQAYVNIMKGCDKYCTYCIVPYTRGKEKSRLIDEVLDDCAKLVAKGVREITLLGQNVNSFGKGNSNLAKRAPLSLHNVIGKVGPNEGEENFPQLLRAMDADPRLTNLKRIRFTSSHPLDFSDELVDCYAPPEHGGVAKLCKHLHLPVQSGSNRILQKMGRHHKIEDYISQMDRLKALSPEIGLSTDMIVGFPTETEEDFQESIRLLDRIQFDSIYAFAYSPRPGTRAEKLPDDVSIEEKNRRLNFLLEYEVSLAAKLYAQRVGKVMEVLVEGPAKNQPKNFTELRWTGHTTCNRIVNFSAGTKRDLKGQFVDVLIESATGLSLSGTAQIDEDFADRIPYSNPCSMGELRT